MTIPSVTPFSVAAPTRDEPSTFSARGDTIMTEMVSMVPQINLTVAAMNAVAADFDGGAEAAAASAASALASANNATAAPGTQATSTTSTDIPTTVGASRSFTIQTGKSIAVGMTLKIVVTASPELWMMGDVTSYNSGTGALVVNVTHTYGTGTYAAWTLSLSSPIMSTTANVVIPKTGAYTLLPTDRGDIFECTGTFTLSLTAAATLGNGWYCYVSKVSGVQTIDPNASETVNGVTTTTVAGFALLYCDGSAFKLHELVGVPTVTIITSTQSWSPPVSGWYEVTVVGGGASGTTSTGVCPIGGAGGGTSIKNLYLASTVSYTATIGAGGAAVSGGNANGTAGGTSSFAGSGITTVSATGGEAGTAAGNGSAGGVGTGGDIHITGGGTANGSSTSSGVTVTGGGSFLSGPTRSNTNATGYGAGAGGVPVLTDPSKAGFQGVIVIKKY